MFRAAMVVVLLTSAGAVAAAPPRSNTGVFAGRIKDVRGILGTLQLAVGEGKTARVLKFDISEARIVGLAGDEWKIGDLQTDDVVRVVMTRSSRLVKQITVLRRPGVPIRD